MVIIATEFKFPDVGEGIHEGTIVKWHVKEGDTVEADKTIVEVETDKAVVELPAPESGTALKIFHKEGDLVKVGEVLIVIGKEGESVSQEVKKREEVPAEKTEVKKAEETKPESAMPASGKVLATPSTRGLARELGVDITKISGSGPSGRITDEDVKAQSAKHKEKIERTPAKKVETQEGDSRIKLTHLRKVIADKMVYSKTHIPHACGMDFVDVTKLVELRTKEKEVMKERGIHLTYLPFILKAAAVALRRMPEFNSHFDEENSELVMKKGINIGVAVDTKEGLMVPVIKDVVRKSIGQIAKEIEELAEQARERKIRLDDMKDGTFTITNVGSVGGMYSTPIINPPEIAIMGVHRIKEIPVVKDGNVVAGKVMGVSLCFDHRVVDGASATEFMNIIKKHLEDPDLLLVDMA